MNYTRYQHTASVLTNGKVLVAGGNNGVYLNSAELYDSSTGVWGLIGNMNSTRDWHTASVLTNGKVLVTGGQNSGGASNSAELYQP
jgi:N-acetylneuraminic acid mutarotase